MAKLFVCKLNLVQIIDESLIDKKGKVIPNKQLIENLKKVGVGAINKISAEKLNKIGHIEDYNE